MVVRCGLRMRGTPDVYTASRQQPRSRHTGHLTQPVTTGRTPGRGPWRAVDGGGEAEEALRDAVTVKCFSFTALNTR